MHARTYAVRLLENVYKALLLNTNALLLNTNNKICFDRKLF